MRVIISGGGTGGHIFPAIAIANALQSLVNGVDILFVGALGKMEMEKVPAAGYKIVGLPIAGIQRSFTLKNILFPFKLIGSLLKARKIISDFNPDVAVGVGGYASGPLLFIATQKGINCLIQEQNSFPGITNKMLASRVRKICVAYDGMEKFFPKEKILLLGNPVREEVTALLQRKDEALDFFKLEKGKKTVLVVGGSLGARTINHSIAAWLQNLPGDIQIIWQTGKSYYNEGKTKESDTVRVLDFIYRMDYAFAAADVIISRAGASTISELCLVGKPVVLVPSPNVAEDHQTKNAMALVNKNAALLVTDKDAVVQLGDVTATLLSNKVQQDMLSTNIKKLALPGSARQIAEEVIKLSKVA
ncbi:MAG: undecaprenyldiphospho-muramoylpentapeptide beta-N-acetylglucosaminyltransferase [Bacteroidetes bacterium]|nr:undecaprenyldiphospho-muramoylpentapeptide beta-N-acetylglucosaminyltransferase [Bacteroidota bacterium]